MSAQRSLVPGPAAPPSPPAGLATTGGRGRGRGDHAHRARRRVADRGLRRPRRGLRGRRTTASRSSFSFGSSTDLAEQAADGAPGDVLATADEASMQLAEDAGVTGDGRRSSRRTRWSLVTPPTTRPASSRSTTSTAPPGCAAPTTCPAAGSRSRLLDDAGVTAEPVSLEDDVKAILAKVTSGEADAGLVYATDAVAAGDDVDGRRRSRAPRTSRRPTSSRRSTSPQDADLAQEWVDLVDVGARARRCSRTPGFGSRP